MPKFELNPRTGIMEPKKDDQIYFAQSQGGGLRIDDHKNNVKYVIERDGRITNLFALDRNKSINLYDMRDARIIADRVVRMFGRDHKYANYEYFLKALANQEWGFRQLMEFMSWSGLGFRGIVVVTSLPAIVQLRIVT